MLHKHSEEQQWWQAASHVPHYTFQQRREFCFISFQDLAEKGIEGESQDIIHVFQFIWPQPVSSSERKRNLLSCFSSLLYFLLFCSLSFLFWRQISRIKYGSHMLLLTIGIHRSAGPTATQTDGQKEEGGR